MGMTTYARGFIGRDDKYHSMEVIYRNCEENNIDIPQAVEDYFQDEHPDDLDDVGVPVDIDEAIEEGSDDNRTFLEIDIKKLPDNVNKIRVYNSW